MRKKTALLILILIITIFPTVFFLVGFFLIVRLVISNSGSVQIYLYNDSLEIMGRRDAVGIGSFSLFVGSAIACTVFFVALSLLIRGWLIERRKKLSARESYTV